MFKYFFLIICSLAITNLSKGQSLFNGKAEYLVELGLDKNSDIQLKAYLGTLLYTNKETYYFEEPEEDETQSEDGLAIFINLSENDNHPIYKDYIKNTMISREYILNKPFRIYDTIPNICWDIIDGEKQIAGLKCLYAESFFRGRKYFAWFSPEVPINIGPWKFGGLPGIIVEIHDENNEVKFKLKRLNKNLTQTQLEMIKPPKKGKIITHCEFFDLQRAKAIELRKFFQSNSSYTDVTINSEVFSIEKAK